MTYLIIIIYLTILNNCKKLDYTSSVEKKYDSIKTLNLLEILEPKGDTSNKVITYTNYKLSFSKRHRQPEWAYYMLTSNMLKKSCQRTNNFRKDKNVDGCAFPKDYYKSGYDKGHLVPARDMAFDCNAMSESFFMTNISPQNPHFNRSIWAALEQKFRDWAIKYDTIFIMTSGILKGNMIDTTYSGIPVPEYYYKVALVYRDNEKKSIAFKMKNEKLKGDISAYSTTIDEIEENTGINFLYKLPIQMQDSLECQNNYEKW